MGVNDPPEVVLVAAGALRVFSIGCPATYTALCALAPTARNSAANCASHRSERRVLPRIGEASGHPVIHIRVQPFSHDHRPPGAQLVFEPVEEAKRARARAGVTYVHVCT